MENQTIRERIFLIINLFCNGKPNRFSVVTGIANATVAGWLDEESPSTPGGAHLITLREGLKRKYEKTISIDWLLTGNGNMFLDDERTQPPLYIASEGLESYNIKAPTEQDRRLLELVNEINALKKRLDIIEKFIMSTDIGPLPKDKE